jgi:predicted transcriptional regulator
MILADTTLTRKSTAMDIATDLLAEIDDDAIMATDGSIEGLLTSLGTRPSRPSIFLRDEFSGLLEMITKKDYYAGMPELLTKLYDGKLQKRLLRKETIEVRDPCLLVFAGGIKNKITGLLTFEHVSSGFMPRFIFITAESDITRVRPLGPPTDWTDSNRSAIIDELRDLYDYYHQEEEFMIKGTEIKSSGPKKFVAQLTPEAWARYNALETEMLDVGMHAERPEIMTPVYDRLAKSILKSAVLLSCTRQKANPVVVEEEDIVRAAVYGESWRMYVRDVMNNVGLGPYERQLHNINNAIIKNPGVGRSQLMQNYHLNARDASAIFETLEQRGLISRHKNGSGRAEVFHPTEIRFKEKA